MGIELGLCVYGEVGEITAFSITDFFMKFPNSWDSFLCFTVACRQAD